jgi:hypothetical protein
MDFFWGNVFEYFKDRRGPALFFVTLVAFFVAIAFGAIMSRVVPDEVLQRIIIYSSPVLGLMLLSSLWLAIRRAQARSRNRYKSSPLSRDEIIKARSKLSNTSNFKKL